MKAFLLGWPERYTGLRFRLMDLSCLSYMAVTAALLVFFHHGVEHWYLEVAIHLLFIFAGLELIRKAEKHQGHKFWRALRIFYPIAFLGYGYLEISRLQPVIFGNYWAADFLASLDKAIFGVYPTVWIERLFSPWLDEIMNFHYWVYYFFLPAVAFPLFLKKEDDKLFAAFGIVTVTYFLNYFLFYLFPALSPRMMPWLASMHSGDHSGYLISSLTRMAQGEGAVKGGCFPSSHVSGSLAWCLAAFRYHRRIAYLLAPLVIGIALSTVYLRYHHAVDPLAGLLLGFAGYWIAVKLLKKRGEDG